MSDTSQGPGWWQASDDKWYPPDLNPGHPLPPPPSIPYPQATGATNGLAIASLVLGILWVLGFGSLLALIFGYAAKRRIRASEGRQGGNGLATAGITLGWVGVGLVMLGVTVNIIQGPSGMSFDGQPVKFTLTKFIDPADDVNGYNTDSQSDHYATVSFSARDEGGSSISSAPVTAIAYGQKGAVYQATRTTPDGDSLCNTGEPADSFSPGETLYYCLAFVIPQSDTVSRIELSPESGYGNGSETWNVTDGFSGWSS